jgi:hypothetical protein
MESSRTPVTRHTTPERGRLVSTKTPGPTSCIPTPKLLPAFDARVELGELEDNGQTIAGHRRVIPIIGGTINGLVTGEILAGGADWQIVRPDGTVQVDARYSARSAEGALLSIYAFGLRAGEPDVLEPLLLGDAIEPSRYYFRTVIRLESAQEFGSAKGACPV